MEVNSQTSDSEDTLPLAVLARGLSKYIVTKIVVFLYNNIKILKISKLSPYKSSDQTIIKEYCFKL